MCCSVRIMAKAAWACSRICTWQSAAPNSGYLEYMYDPGFWNPEGFQVGFTAPYPIDNEGYVHAPQTPGWGVPWSREFFAKHKLYWEA